ncbi:hypothetical protein EAF00_006807 [Botryotinia globosa]|nr:hypothetical protein EAF00_006807 [Botryotinia globosa]
MSQATPTSQTTASFDFTSNVKDLPYKELTFKISNFQAKKLAVPQSILFTQSLSHSWYFPLKVTNMASDCEITAFDVLRTWTFDHLKILMIEATELEAESTMRNARIEVKDGYVHHSEEIISNSGRISELDRVIAHLVIEFVLLGNSMVLLVSSSFSAIPLCPFGIEYDITIE